MFIVSSSFQNYPFLSLYSQMESCPILSLLTDDLLVRILDQLAARDSSSSDIKSFRMVCKAFHRVDSLHRTRLRVLRLEFIPTLLHKFTRVDSLDLSVCPLIDDGTVAALLSCGSLPDSTRRLKTLILSRSTGLRSAGLELLVRSCPFLEAIDVSYCCKLGDREAASLSCAVGLKDLRMDKCLKLTDVGLAKISVGCGNLERLSLKWCLEITDLGIDLLSKKCPNLKHLDLSYLKVTKESLRSVGTMRHLEFLIMVGCGLVDDAGLHYIGYGCPSLQELDVSRCDNISSPGITSFISRHAGLTCLNVGYCHWELSATILHHHKDLKNLKTNIVDGTKVSDSSLQIISLNCRYLVEIGLSKCKGVSDTGIMLLVSGCCDLKKLDLTCCSALTDVAVSAVANCCRDLCCLKLESCNLLTEKVLEHLGICCLLLEELDLTDCSGVNYKGLEYLSGCSELKLLKLGLCTNISGKGLSYIATNCTKIHCIDVGDGGLAALSRGCKKLQKLNLSYCNSITDGGVTWLSKLKELSDLELRGLHDITGAGLATLASGCQKLAKLDLKHCVNIDDSGFWAVVYYSRNLQQINLSYCAISDVGLCMVMGNSTRLQDAKLVNLINVSVNGFELALRASYVRLKKVKLPASIGIHLSFEVLKTLRTRGCWIRWH